MNISDTSATSIVDLGILLSYWSEYLLENTEKSYYYFYNQKKDQFGAYALYSQVSLTCWSS